MRRTAVLTAALSAASIALLAPAATAAPAAQPDPLSGTVSCATDGTVAVHTSVDADGTEHGTAVVKGVSVTKWAGSLSLGGDEAPAQDFTAHTAKGGRFTVTGTAVGAQSRDAVATFFGAGFKNACVAGIEQENGVIVVTDGGSGLAVREGAKPVVGAVVVGTKRHRYQLDFTIKDGKRVEHQRLVRTANRKGRLKGKIHAPRRLGANAVFSVRITDLTKHGRPLVFTLG